MPATSRFRARVISVVRRIPAGRVATYGDVAAAAGVPRAARAVGNIMRDCRAPGVPCHRVIGAGGVEKVVELELTAEEKAELQKSFQSVKKTVDEVKL